MRLREINKKALLDLIPVLFFGALLSARVSHPSVLIFDEIHYVPAAKALISFSSLMNWEHPPLAKWIMGLFWYLFSKTLPLIQEPGVFRVSASLFGVWALTGVRAWMLHLGFRERAAQAALWLTGFNFIWFVQSKTAMLDVFFLAFAIWGTLRVDQGKRLQGWILLGLSTACKWASAPYLFIALWIDLQKARTGRRPSSAWQWFKPWFAGLVAYILPFVPLSFLKTDPIYISDLVDYHRRMLGGFDQVATAPHPYLSQWWEWPLLLRPLWYSYETHPSSEQYVWAAGNPVLFWISIPFLFLIGWYGLFGKEKNVLFRSRAPRLMLLYWVPLLFWAVVPRKLQLFYYYLPSSLMLGPIVVWAHEKFLTHHKKLKGNIVETVGWYRDSILLGFVLLCATAFFYFLPVMDARNLEPGRYFHYMWFMRWI